MNLPLAVYVYVHHTIIRSFGSKRIQMQRTIAAGAVGLEDCFLAFLPKPKALVDDLPVTKWRLVELHPNEAASVDTEALRTRVQEAQ